MSHTPAPWMVEKEGDFFNVVCNQEGFNHYVVGNEGLYRNDGCDEANARLIAAAPTGLAVAESTYLALLKMSHDSLWRTFNQQVYCDLRDFIADATGRDGEEVQNEFEQRAMEGL